MTEDSATTVLIVEDEIGLAELYEAFLEDTYTVRMATSGEEALELYDAMVDIVLLDRRMPGTSGEEVLTELRAMDGESRIAMLTAVEPAGDLLEFPIDDYRAKPISSDELHQLVDSLQARDAYDEQSQRYFALASKLAAFEAAGKSDGAEYEELHAELTELQQELDSQLADIGPQTALRELLDSTT